jgi:hypothetical protein
MSIKTYLLKKKKAIRKKVVRKKVARKKTPVKKISGGIKMKIKKAIRTGKGIKNELKRRLKSTVKKSKKYFGMSGIPNFKKNVLSDYSKILMKQKELEYGIVSNQRILKVPGQPKQQKDNARKLIKLYKLLLSENKTHAAQLKKLM